MSSNKKYVVEANFAKEAVSLDLTLPEFLLLMYFDNSDNLTFDIDEICKKLKLDMEIILNAFNSLMTKELIVLSSEKNENGKRYDKISLEGFYEKIKDTKQKEKKEKIKEDIFSTIESEFKRPLNGTEIEIIKTWLEKYYGEELIREALKEAVYYGALNIRYIDTILYEWDKKGIKTKEDLDNRDKIKQESRKLEETSVFDYNWLDDEDR